MSAIDADGVFGAGGVTGLALAGALHEFAVNERLSVRRWCGVAGAGTGAMIAACLAAGRAPADLGALLAEAPFADARDAGPGGRLLGGAVGLVRRRGLVRGEVLRRWLDHELGGMTFAAVRAAAEDGEEPEHAYHLQMIAADVTNHRVLVLPDDLRRYRRPGERAAIDPDDVRVADAVRMSLSTPYFFQPVELCDGNTGRASAIVDGTIAGFPVWLFDTSRREPRRPTFGLRIVGGRAGGRAVQRLTRLLGWPVALASDIARTRSGAWDERFLTASTRVRTCAIDAGEVGATDFRLPAARKADLINGGRRAAAAFLASADLGAYRNTFGRGLEATAVR